MGTTRARDPLTAAAVAFMAANILHTLDHIRQGTGRLTTEVLAGGSLLTVLAAVVLVVVLRGNPRAPAFAALVGMSGAIGIAASHLAPHWSALSDPYPDLSVDALSWAVMLLEIAAAAVLAIVAALELRRPAARPLNA
jgi:hypothetical protein